MTLAEKLRLLAEFTETGEEFEINDQIYYFENNLLIYKNDGEKEIISDIVFNEFECADVTQLPFKPKIGEVYYFVSSRYKDGFAYVRNVDCHFDRRILSRETVYRTEAEAQEEVRKRGWTVDN